MVIPFKASVSILLMLLLPVAVAAQQSTLDVWTTLLKPHHFGDVEVIEDRTVIDLVTPYRAEDAAVTPVHIKAMIPQTAERYIKTIYLFVDKNPEPLVGIFEFTEEVGRADLALRIRVDKYTDVRAVAVLNDGAHHMVANFVKAQGGCAIPLSIDSKGKTASTAECCSPSAGRRGLLPARCLDLIGEVRPHLVGHQLDAAHQGLVRHVVVDEHPQVIDG